MATAPRPLRRRATVAPMSRPPSPHRAKALERLQAGATAAEVSAELGVSLRTVEGWAASLGLRERGQRGPDREQRAHGPHGHGHAAPRAEALPVIDLLLQGVPIAEIAATLKRTRQAIEKVRDRWLSDEE